VDGQPPAGCGSLGRSIGSGRRSYSRPHLTSAASGSDRVAATSNVRLLNVLERHLSARQLPVARRLRYSPPSCCRTSSRLPRKVAMVGWLGPRVVWPISRARSSWVRAPSRSPRACSTTPRLLCRMAMVGWLGPRAASPISRTRSWWLRARSTYMRRASPVAERRVVSYWSRSWPPQFW
jgi:hypothetical protein